MFYKKDGDIGNAGSPMTITGTTTNDAGNEASLCEKVERSSSGSAYLFTSQRCGWETRHMLIVKLEIVGTITTFPPFSFYNNATPRQRGS